MPHFLWISEVTRMALPSILSPVFSGAVENLPNLLFSDNCPQSNPWRSCFLYAVKHRSNTGVMAGNRDSVNQSYELETM